MRQKTWLAIIFLWVYVLALSEATAQFAPQASQPAALPARANSTPVQYILLDVSLSMGYDRFGHAIVHNSKNPFDTLPRRIDLVSAWLQEHGQAELAAGRKVIIILFNTLVLDGKNQRFEIVPGPRAEGDLDAAIKTILNMTPHGDTRIWGSIGELIDKELRSAPQNSGISVFTDGLEDDSAAEEPRVTKELKDAWQLTDFELKYSLRKYVWKPSTSVTDKAFVAPPTAVIDVSEHEIVFEARELLDAKGTGKKVNVALHQGPTASANDQLTLSPDPSRVEQLSGPKTTLNLSSALQPKELSKNVSKGQLEVRVAGSYQGSEDLVYAIQPQFVYTTDLAGVDPNDKMTPVNAGRIRVIIHGVKASLTQLALTPKQATLGQPATFTLTGTASADAGGKQVTLTPSLSKKEVTLQWDDAGDRAQAPNGGPLKVTLPQASGPGEIHFTKQLIASRVNGQEKVNDTLTVTGLLAGPVGAQQEARAELVFGTIRVITSLTGSLKPANLPEPGTREWKWQPLNAQLLVQIADPALLPGKQFDVIVKRANEGGDVEIAFDQNGNAELPAFDRQQQRDKPIQLYARWKTDARNFAAPQVQPVQIMLKEHPGSNLDYVETNTTLQDLNALVLPIAPRLWIVENEKELEEDYVDPTKRIVKLGGTDSAVIGLRWNCAAAGLAVTIKKDEYDVGVKISGEPKVSGGLQPQSAETWVLSKELKPATLDYRIEVGEVVVPGARAKWHVNLASTGIARTVVIGYDLQPRPSKPTFTPDPGLSTVRRPGSGPFELGVLSVPGTGEKGDLTVTVGLKNVAEASGIQLAGGVEQSMGLKITVPADLQDHKVHVFATATASGNATGGEKEGEITVSMPEEGGLKLVEKEGKYQFRFRLEIPPPPPPDIQFQPMLASVKSEAGGKQSVKLGVLNVVGNQMGNLTITIESQTASVQMHGGVGEKEESVLPAAPSKSSSDIYVTITPTDTKPRTEKLSGILRVAKAGGSAPLKEFPFTLEFSIPTPPLPPGMSVEFKVGDKRVTEILVGGEPWDVANMPTLKTAALVPAELFEVQHPISGAKMVISLESGEHLSSVNFASNEDKDVPTKALTAIEGATNKWGILLEAKPVSRTWFFGTEWTDTVIVTLIGEDKPTGSTVASTGSKDGLTIAKEGLKIPVKMIVPPRISPVLWLLAMPTLLVVAVLLKRMRRPRAVSAAAAPVAGDLSDSDRLLTDQPRPSLPVAASGRPSGTTTAVPRSGAPAQPPNSLPEQSEEDLLR